MLSSASTAYRRSCYRLDQSWVESHVLRLPRQFGTIVRRAYTQQLFDVSYRQDGEARRKANTLVRTECARIRRLGGKVDLSANDEELCFASKRAADLVVQRLLYLHGLSPDDRLTALLPFLHERGVHLGEEKGVPDDAYRLPKRGNNNVTASSLLDRLSDDQFWRRVLRRHAARKVEAEAIRQGLVNIGVGCYVSDDTLQRCRMQRLRNHQLMDALTLINEQGDSLTMREAWDASVSNPENRRNEAMTRISGFERIARECGHVGLFITATLPSRFHAYRKVAKRKAVPNPKYADTTPRDGQRQLSAEFAAARAKLHRAGIRPYGFRIAEPHHDGTPHWHFLLFVEARHRDALVDVLRAYFTREDAAELVAAGTDAPRFKAIDIDWNRGSAAGYVAKYVAKNIDGKRLDGESIGTTFDGDDAVTAAERVQAWASVWGIRQFQQIGIAPVTLWRELRRIANEGMDYDSALLERAVAAADEGDWAEYVRVLGGTGLTLADIPLGMARQCDLTNRYGELVISRIDGVIDRTDGELVRSRLHVWRVEFRRLEAGERERRETGTSVNNCTPALDGGTPATLWPEHLSDPVWQRSPAYLVPEAGYA